MLYIVCPSCGEVLGNKQLVYESEMKKTCDNMGIDFDMVSRGVSDKDEDYVKARQAIVNKICRHWCCKQLLITYVDLVRLIKG